MSGERPHKQPGFDGALLAERSDSKKRDSKTGLLHANVLRILTIFLSLPF